MTSKKGAISLFEVYNPPFLLLLRFWYIFCMLRQVIKQNSHHVEDMLKEGDDQRCLNQKQNFINEVTTWWLQTTHEQNLT